MSATQDEWLWGWDPTPGIVSVWAEPDGRAWVWRRLLPSGELVCDRERFRPWLLMSSLQDLEHLGPRLLREPIREPVREPDAAARADAGPGEEPAGLPRGAISYQELDGPGELRFLVRCDDGRALESAVLRGASRRLGQSVGALRYLDEHEVLSLPPEEQYLVATGRTYFRDLAFDDLRRAQFDLETTGLHPETSRIFLIAVRDPRGEVEVLEAAGDSDADEAELLRQLSRAILACDPDVIENHNLHGFDLPFLVRRAELLDVPLMFGRGGGPGLRQRPSARGASFEPDRREPKGRKGKASEVSAGRGQSPATPATAAATAAATATTASPAPEPPGGGNSARRTRLRYTVPGREMIDSLDAVRRHDFAARDLPGHGLKAVARHLGLASETREYVAGADVYDVFRRDPARIRRYASDDVQEAAGVGRVMGGAAFALARMVPRRYERLADTGAATGMIDPLLVRAYLRAGAALPAHHPGDGTPHSGAALHLFATGVAHRVVKADVASLYPSLMREHRIGPSRDRLGALLFLVDRLVAQRLAAKARARLAPEGSAERHLDEAMSAAMKLVVNSAYGYLGAGALTRFSDVHAANEVTRRGRQLLSLLCRELAARGVTLLEADTDGVYFAVPPAWDEADERRVVAEVDALLPELVQLQFDGRYAAMLSHEPKNYALLPYHGALLLRGVAFRSSRAEPFGEAFLRRALEALLRGDLAEVNRAYLETIAALRRRELPTFDVSARVRLSKTPAEYEAVRAQRRELPYEAMLQSGHEQWRRNATVRVYRAVGGRPALALAPPLAGGEVDDAEAPEAADASAAGNGAEAPAAPAVAAAPADPRDYDADYYVKLLRATFASRLATALTPEDFAALFVDPDQLSLFAPAIAEVRTILTPVPEALEAVGAVAAVGASGSPAA
jgi:DNA polymerase, archaea type